MTTIGIALYIGFIPAEDYGALSAEEPDRHTWGWWYHQQKKIKNDVIAYVVDFPPFASLHPLGKDGHTKTDELSEKFQGRGVGSFTI